jgi:hypothetical protein
MKPKQVVSSLIDELSNRLATPIRTAGVEESRPVPAILVDGLDITHENHHNSTYAGDEWSNGQIQNEIHRHYYSARIDLQVRDDDEIGAYDILSDLQAALSKIENNPRKWIHDDVNTMELLSSGQISYQLHEPTETEINQSLVIGTFYDSTHSDAEAIDSVSKSYDFN